MQSFHDLNKAYVQEKLVSANPSEHWQVLLEELMSERDKGRVEGPLQAPDGGGTHFNEAKGMPLQEPGALGRHSALQLCRVTKSGVAKTTDGVPTTPR